MTDRNVQRVLAVNDWLVSDRHDGIGRPLSNGEVVDLATTVLIKVVLVFGFVAWVFA